MKLIGASLHLGAKQELFWRDSEWCDGIPACAGMTSALRDVPY